MELSEAKRDFIHSWGSLHIDWGSSKTTGLVHGLLLLTVEPLCANTIIETLSISRGSTNTATRTLMDYGLVHKHFKEGDRKEYFIAEKDVYAMFQRVVELRRRRELDPMLAALNKLNQVHPSCEESKEYCNVIQDLLTFSNAVDKALGNVLTCDPKWLTNSYLS